MNPELWALDRITPYPNNARTHPEAQVSLLSDLIKKHGADQPIVVDDDGVILKGHGRRLAAISAGLKEFPVVQRKGLTASQKSAMRIEDNQVALLSGWDNALLKTEIIDLQTAGYPIALLGFAEHQLLKFGVSLDQAGATDPDVVVEPPKIPVSRAGDIWVMGDHRLMCGDSTDPEIVARLLDGARPHLMVTDPPYGVSFDRGKYVSPEKAGKGKFEPIASDGLRGDELSKFIEKIIDAAFKDRDGVFYFWGPSLAGYPILEGMLEAKIRVQSQIIWRKTPFLLGQADYQWQHEICWYGFRGKNHPWYGGRDKGTVWDIPKPQRMEYHPTTKPVPCMKYPIENSSKPGDSVYEPFSGSGTTIIAAQMTGRRAYAMELAPAYVDAAVLRWQAFTCLDATMDGKTFVQVAKARSKSKIPSTGSRRRGGSCAASARPLSPAG